MTFLQWLCAQLVVVALAVGFAFGLWWVGERMGWIGQPTVIMPAENVTVDSLVKVIEKHYVDETDRDDLLVSALKGMVSGLDHHTSYLDGRNLKQLAQQVDGEMAGIGIIFELQEGIPTVTAAIEGTPAEKAGMDTGDQIVKVNGQDCTSLSDPVQAQDMILGPEGEVVQLTVRKADTKQVAELDIVRAMFDIPTVWVEDIPDFEGLVRLRLSVFAENSARLVEKALEKIERPRGIVIDVRSNPGGALKGGVDVADLFLDEGVVVSLKGRHYQEESLRSKSGDAWEDIPCVVLIDEGSASASEILAGALQDRGRALLVGRRSYGKGTVQELFPFGEEDKQALKLTVARFYSPKGRSFSRRADRDYGLEPDVMVDLEESQGMQEHRIALIAAHLDELGLADLEIEGQHMTDYLNSKVDFIKDQDQDLIKAATLLQEQIAQGK